MRLSAVIIVKNGENLILDCIKNLSFCDEVVVIDNGSTDRTAEIASNNKAKVLEIDSNDFSEIRNFGLKSASFEWVLYIDIDERVSEELKKEIKSKISDPNSPAAFKIKRKNFYFGNYVWPQIEKLERLFQKEKLKGWYGKIHESPRVDGKIGELEGMLFHYTHSDLTSMLDKTIEWSKIEADLKFSSNHPKMTWWRFPRVMVTTFISYYFLRRGYKIGIPGLIESMYQAFSTFITYARLWELQNKKK